MVFKIQEETRLSSLRAASASSDTSAIIVAAGSSERFNIERRLQESRASEPAAPSALFSPSSPALPDFDHLKIPDCADEITAPGEEASTQGAHQVAASKYSEGDDGEDPSFSKTLAPLSGMPLIAWSVLAADAAPSIAEIILVVRGEDLAEVKRIVAGLPTVVPIVLAQGGKTRQESVRHGLGAVNPLHHFVTILDGARPLVTSDTIEATIRSLRLRKELAGVVAGFPSVDTLKVVDSDDMVCGTPDRDRYWCIQTPQTFRKADLRDAHTLATSIGLEGTDDASLVENAGKSIGCLDLQRDNIKVTLPMDLVIAEALLASRKKNDRAQQSRRGL